MDRACIELAWQVAELLEQKQRRVVFAESCTGGLVSATLARVPGISQWLCGSAVTYRERTKTDWLRVPESLIQRDTAVSESVAREMALGVLGNTVEADFATAVTGHLGPNAPRQQDGLVFVAVVRREDGDPLIAAIHRCQLERRTRLRRQEEAVAIVLQTLRATLAAEQ